MTFFFLHFIGTGIRIFFDRVVFFCTPHELGGFFEERP